MSTRADLSNCARRNKRTSDGHRTNEHHGLSRRGAPLRNRPWDGWSHPL